jgi:hypothetical protein
MHYVTHPRVEKRMNVKETFVVVIPPVHSVLILIFSVRRSLGLELVVVTYISG